MAPTPRRRTTTPVDEPKPLILGILGSGELAEEALVALFDGLGQVDRVIFPVTDVDLTDELEHLRRHVVAEGIPYDVVTDEATSDTKDKVLRKALDEAADEYPAEDGTAAAVIELLKENDYPDLEARVLILFDPETDEDVAAFELAADAGLPAYDLCNSLELMKFEDDEQPTEVDPEPEPEVETTRRGRRGAAAEQVDDEPVAASEVDTMSKEEAARFKDLTGRDSGLIELKQTIRKLAPKEHKDNKKMAGWSKEQLATLIIELERGAEGDEVQESTRTARARRVELEEIQVEGADEPEGDEEGQDAQETVFARLRGQREASDRIATGLAKSMGTMTEGMDPQEALEVFSGALAGALMAFADHVITEVRKPKQPGRPRKDGTPAQPRKATDHADDSDQAQESASAAPSRRRGRS